MRLLPYPAATLLASLLCAPLGCVVAADDTATTNEVSTSQSASTSTTSDDTTSEGTTVSPPDDTTTAADSGSDTGMSSSDGGGGGQACGNGVIEGTEKCDCGGEPCSPAGLNGAQCAGLTNPQFPMRVYTGGILDCSPASCQFTFATCSFCGDGVLNGNEVCEQGDDPNVSCQDLGMGSSTNDLPCGPDCQIDTTCCEMPLPKGC